MALVVGCPAAMFADVLQMDRLPAYLPQNEQ